VLVRRALSKAIDRAALIRDVIGCVGLPATSLLPPGMPGFQQRLGRELEFDPEGARALLAQAGFPNGRGFPRLAFTFQGTSEQQRRVEFMRAQWKQHLNIDVELNSLQKQAYHQAVNNRDCDIVFTGWIADYPDPQNWFSASFGCKRATSFRTGL
jgi:oligopeptide transport system substrate-binding protein